MRIFTIAIAATLLLISCGGEGHRSLEPLKEKPDSTPAALQSETSDFSLKKRGSEDLVGKLYDELAEKNPALKALEKQIGALAEPEKNALSPFEEYDGKNSSYHTAAGTHISSIHDSVLRKKLEAVLQADSAAYEKTISDWRVLLARLDKQKDGLHDLHTALMIYKTLPLIRQYREQHLPDTRELEALLKAYQAAIDKTAAAGGGQ